MSHLMLLLETVLPATAKKACDHDDGHDGAPAVSNNHHHMGVSHGLSEYEV